jgi:hypothetical protein
MFRRLAVVLALAVVLPSCKKSSDDPAAGSGAVPSPATMTEDELVTAALRSMEAIATLAKRHASDCESLAKALADHATRHADLIKAFKKLAADEAKQREIATRYGGRIMQIGQDTIKAIEAHCAGHPAVKKLFESLN